MRLETIRLQRVEYMPKQLEPGILYISEKFGAVAHLCACGCGTKIRTPLGPTEWSITQTRSGPSLWPSIGNWQQACQSHYIIRDGKIVWCGKWTPEQIAAGRLYEEERRKAYYDALYADRGVLSRIWRWLKNLLGL
jgi:Family of unknown function (DUF6527)